MVCFLSILIQKQHPVKLNCIIRLILVCTVFLSSCDRKSVPQWSTAELSFEACNHYSNPYTAREGIFYYSYLEKGGRIHYPKYSGRTALFLV